MANPEHLEILRQGVAKWNAWRKENAYVTPDLSAANLSFTDLSKANLSQALLLNANLLSANLNQADLSGADLFNVNLLDAKLHNATLSKANLNDASLHSAELPDADLCGAWLRNAKLRDAKLHKAKLSGADLSEAVLDYADLSGADLTNADLTCADFVETNFCGANITGCRVYGVSAWNVKLEGTIQQDLVISRQDEPRITVDNLEVAQFIYLLLNNTKIRDVINTITAKGVLILGRFADAQRKAVLDGLREKLREFDLLPMVFDFDRPTDKDYTETIQTLAGMSMFVIADVTSPKSSPLELEATVKQFKIPFLPILDVSVDPHPFSMLADLQKSFHWVLPTLQYETKEDLLDDENLETYIIDRAVAKRAELRRAKTDEPEPILIRKKAVTSTALPK